MYRVGEGMGKGGGGRRGGGMLRCLACMLCDYS